MGRAGEYGKTSWQGEGMLAHQAAFLITHGWRPRGRGVVIRHSCDEPKCCEPSHLLIGTQKQNAGDRMARGRQPRRVSYLVPGAKFTPEQVREIRERHDAGESYTKLGLAFGMHPQNIGRICRRQGYRDVA